MERPSRSNRPYRWLPRIIRFRIRRNVSAVDTTGCGDAFHGAYAWALTRGEDLMDRVEIASAAAAVVAALPPEAKRVPSREAIEQLLTAKRSL